MGRHSLKVGYEGVLKSSLGFRIKAHTYILGDQNIYFGRQESRDTVSFGFLVPHAMGFRTKP